MKETLVNLALFYIQVGELSVPQPIASLPSLPAIIDHFQYQKLDGVGMGLLQPSPSHMHKSFGKSKLRKTQPVRTENFFAIFQLRYVQ